MPKGGSADAEPADDKGALQGLEPEQVQRVVLSRYGAFQACMGLTTKPDRGPEDKLAIAWEIAPDGSVVRSTLVGSTLGEPRVEGCMLRVVNLMKFPAAPGPTKVQFPFAYGRQRTQTRPPSRAPLSSAQRTAVKQRPHQETGRSPSGDERARALHDGREGGGGGRDNVRPSASTACWAARSCRPSRTSRALPL